MSITRPTVPRQRVLLLATALLAAACGQSSHQASDGLVIQVASYDLSVGPNSRFLVGAFTADHHFIGYGTASARVAYLGRTEQDRNVRYGQAVAASFLSIPGTEPPEPAPTAPQVVDALSGRGVYAASIAFDQPGFWQVELSARIGGRRQTATAAFLVGDQHQVPAVGDLAPVAANLTTASAGIPLSAVDSRAANGSLPDPELHRTTIAASLAAHRPIVAVFATPVFCVSRFCGPVTDMVQELASRYADRAEFIHVEIWRDFNENKINDSAAVWLEHDGALEEPWVFLIGADGRIAARFDNVATVADVEGWLQRLPRQDR